MALKKTEINIMDGETVARIIGDINVNQTLERRQFEYKQWVCYRGRLKRFVADALKQMLPKDSEWMDAADINISQKIVDKLAKAYKEPPLRSVGDGTDDTKTKILSEIYDDGCFNDSFKWFDKRINLHKYGALWVVEREVDGQPKLELEVVPAYAVFPIFDESTGELVQITLNYPSLDVTHFGNKRTGSQSNPLSGQNIFTHADGTEQIIAENQDDKNTSISTYVMWTKTQHAVYEVEDKIDKDTGKPIRKITFVDIQDDPDLRGVNDLGVIPFVWLSTEGGTELPVRHAITDQSIYQNVDWSALRAAAIRNIGTAVLEHPEGQKVKDVTTGLNTVVRIEQPKNIDARPSSFRYENPNTDLAGQQNVFLSNLVQIFGQYGIRSNEAITGTSIQEFSSAIERVVANADVTDHIEDTQKMYMKTEQSVFTVVKAYDGRRGGKNFSKDDKLTVIYPKPKLLISDGDKLDVLKKRKEMGTISRTGQMQIIDPNLSKPKAEKFLEEVDKENIKDMGKNAIDIVGRLRASTDKDDLANVDEKNNGKDNNK